MDEKQVKQIIRQLKFLNFWVAFFGIIFILSFAVLAVLIFKVATALNNAQESITNFRQETTEKLNVKDDICQRDSPLAGTQICQ